LEGDTTQQEAEFDDASGIKMLNNFYHEYIPLVENSLDFKKIEKLQKDNCSAVFYKEYLNWEIDYDPFINAQDANSESLNSLTIERIKKRNKTFRVTYISPYNQKIIEIVITLDIIEGDYKIVGIDQ